MLEDREEDGRIIFETEKLTFKQRMINRMVGDGYEEDQRLGYDAV
jgi:hypothetical protein